MFQITVSFSRSRCALELVARRHARKPAARSVLKDLVDAREIGLCVGHDAAQSREHRRAACRRGHRAARPGSAPRSRAPRDPHAAEVALERPAKALRRARQRRADRAGRARPSRDSSSATSPTLRAIGPCTPSVSPRPRASRGTRPGDGRNPTTLQKLAGIAQRAAQVGAVGERQHAAGERRRRAAAAAAAGLREVVGVARRAENRVESLRAGAELRRVGLADHDRAGVLAALDDQVVRCRARSRGRSASRRSCGCRAVSDEVLDRDRQPVQRADARRRARRAASAAAAAASSSARGSSVGIAFTCGSSRSICARNARITSTAEISRPRRARRARALRESKARRLRRAALATWRKRGVVTAQGSPRSAR